MLPSLSNQQTLALHLRNIVHFGSRLVPMLDQEHAVRLWPLEKWHIFGGDIRLGHRLSTACQVSCSSVSSSAQISPDTLVTHGSVVRASSIDSSSLGHPERVGHGTYVRRSPRQGRLHSRPIRAAPGPRIDLWTFLKLPPRRFSRLHAAFRDPPRRRDEDPTTRNFEQLFLGGLKEVWTTLTLSLAVAIDPCKSLRA